MLIVPPWPPAGESLVLSREKAHHALHVLRMESGAPVCLMDGNGRVAKAVFEIAGKSQARLRIAEEPRPAPDPVAPMDAIVALPRHETMDTVVRQACEMGVRSLHPVLSERSAIPARVARQKADHWLRVAVSACEQCRRARLPEIHPAARLEDVLSRDFSRHARLFFWEEAAGDAHAWNLENEPAIVAAVGCEGGWSPKEAEAFLAAGFRTLSLGPLILRVDTAFAAVAALGIHFLRTRQLF